MPNRSLLPDPRSYVKKQRYGSSGVPRLVGDTEDGPVTDPLLYIAQAGVYRPAEEPERLRSRIGFGK